MTKPLLIGLTGLAGSGKDTVRNILEGSHGTFGLAFADPIREMLRALLAGCHLDDSWMTDRVLKESTIPGIGASYREMAQLLGTEWGRAIDPDFWLKITAVRVAALRAMHRPVVISDVRFPNEAAWIRSEGGVVWKILRPGVEPVRAHASEAHVDALPYDYVIDNSGSIANLERAVQGALFFGDRQAA